MPDTDEPLADRWSKRLKNNPFVAGAIVIGGVLLGVVTFLTQIQEGLDKLKPQKPSAPAVAAAPPPAAAAPTPAVVPAAAPATQPQTTLAAAPPSPPLPPPDPRLCVKRVNLGGASGPLAVQDCDLKPGEAYAVVRGNVDSAILRLEQVLDQKDFSLFPAMNAYENQQSPEAWAAVRAEAAGLETVVVTALEEVKALARKRPDLRPALAEVAGSLGARRAAALTFQNRTSPPSREEYQRMRTVFREEAIRLRGDLEDLRRALPPVA